MNGVRYWVSILISLFAFFAASCAFKSKDKKPEEMEEKEILELIARVQSRPGNKDFVLLEAFGKWTLDDGVNLHVYGENGRTATLVTSGEKLGQFVAADVKSGKVELGDSVYHRKKVMVPKQKSVAPPANEKPKPSNEPDKPAAGETGQDTGVIEPVPLPSY